MPGSGSLRKLRKPSGSLALTLILPRDLLESLRDSGRKSRKEAVSAKSLFGDVHAAACGLDIKGMPPLDNPRRMARFTQNLNLTRFL